MKNTMKKMLSLLLVVVMFLGGVCIPDAINLNTVNAAETESFAVGDVIEFGSYPQTEVTDSAYEGKTVEYNNKIFAVEPIKWRVLRIVDGNALLLTDKIIEGQPFNSTSATVDGHKANEYHYSSLRKWVTEDFFNTAFSPNEQTAIETTQLESSADKIFMLSKSEADSYAKNYFSTTATDYAYANGFVAQSSTELCNQWWTRTAHTQSYAVYYVQIRWGTWTTYYNWYDDTIPYPKGVRPAIYIDLDAFSQLQNNVCSDGHDWDISADGNFFICSNCKQKQSVSPVSGYTFGKDSFSFKNIDVGDYDISYSAYRDHLLPAMKVDVLSLIANGVVRFVNYIKRGDTYGGACFGIAAMNASLFSNIQSSSYGANTVSELSIAGVNQLSPNNATKLKDSINIMWTAQSFSPVFFFQSIQESVGNKRKQLVNIAKSLSAGDYLPVVNFEYSAGVHAVNIIGIMPDDFAANYYVITVYDSNNSQYPNMFLISKDFSSGTFREYSANQNKYVNYNLKDIKLFITSKAFSIDYFAPGLRDCNLCYNNSLANRVGSSSVQLNDNVDLEYFNENYINYAILSDAQLTLTDADGGYFTILNGEIVSTNLETIYVIPIVGSNLTRETVPYNGSEYTVTSDEDYYIHMNYNHQNTALYCENGGELKGTIAETIQFTPKCSESTYDISYYAADLFTNSDVIGCIFNGTGSNFAANLTSDGIIVEDADFESLGFSVRHDDEGYTIEDIALEKDSAIQNITISYTDNEIMLEYEKESSEPDVPTEPEEPIEPDVPTDPETPDDPSDDTTDCSCLCHSKNSFMQFIYTILRFLWQLFGMNMDCACGAKHFDSYFFG